MTDEEIDDFDKALQAYPPHCGMVEVDAETVLYLVSEVRALRKRVQNGQMESASSKPGGAR